MAVPMAVTKVGSSGTKRADLWADHWVAQMVSQRAAPRGGCLACQKGVLKAVYWVNLLAAVRAVQSAARKAGPKAASRALPKAELTGAPRAARWGTPTAVRSDFLWAARDGQWVYEWAD